MEVTEEIVWLPLLETVSIDAPGWIPSDNFFHLLAATPYSARLQRYKAVRQLEAMGYHVTLDQAS